MSAFNQDSGAKLLGALKRGIENITLNVLNENPRDYHKRGRVISQDEWGWILSIDNATYTRVPSLERVADYKQGDVVEVMIPNGQPSNMFIMGRIGGVVSSGGSGDFIVGNVTTQTLDAGLNAEVDVEYNTETGKVDFSFAIPQGDKGDNAGEYVNTNQVFINRTTCDWQLNDVSTTTMMITPIIHCVGKIAIHFDNNLRGQGLILYILSRTGGKAQQYDVKDVYITEEVYEFEFDDDIRIAIMAPGGIDAYYESIQSGTKIYTLGESALFDYLRKKIIGRKSIYCFGDSLTAGVITGTTTIPEGYPYWLKKFLKNEDIDIRNYGVAGATVKDMYNKISTLDFINCDIAILMIGTNGYIAEGTDSINDYNACIESIINSSKGKAKIVLMNPPKSVRDGVPQRWLDEMHYTIEKIANNYGLDCIDLYNFLPFDVTNKTYYSDDGVHLTKNGYYYVAFIIYNYLINNMTASQKGGSPTFDY